jgi:hypothetical protein
LEPIRDISNIGYLSSGYCVLALADYDLSVVFLASKVVAVVRLQVGYMIGLMGRKIIGYFISHLSAALPRRL